MLPIILWSLGVAVALGAPAVVVARWRLSWTRLPRSRARMRGGPFRPADVDEAICAFVERRPMRTDNLLVEWRDGPWFTHPSKPGARLSGIALNDRSIVVAAPPGQPIGRTALFHELMHVALEREGGLARTTHEAWTDEDRAIEAELTRMFR